MPLRTACSSCGKKLQVRDELAGKKVKCPSCGTAFVAVADGAAIKAGPAKPNPAAVKASPKPPPRPAPPPMDDEDDEDERPVRAPAKAQLKRPAPPPPPDDDDEDDDDDDRPRGKTTKPAKSRGRLWIYLSLALVLLLGGAAAAYFLDLIPGLSSTNTGPLVKGGQKGGGQNQGGQNAAGIATLEEIVPGDAFAFATVNSAILNAKVLDELRPKAAEWLQKELGLALADLDRVSVVTVATFEQTKQSKDAPGVILIQTNKPVDQGQVSAAVAKSMFSKNNPQQIEFLDAQTFVISPPSAMQMYKDKRGKTKAAGALAKALAQAAASQGILVAVDVPPGVAQDAKALGKGAAMVGPFLKTKEVFGKVDLDERLQVQAALTLEDANSAQEAKAMLDKMIGSVPLMLDFFGGNDPAAAPFIKVAKQALKDLKIGVEGADVTAALQVDVTALMKEIAPLMQKVQGAAASTLEMNNLKQIGIAFHNHQSVHQKLPPQTMGKGLSWRVAILPFIEQDELYKRFKLDEPWDSPANKELVAFMPPIYESAGAKGPPGHTFYQMFVGPKTINANARDGMRLAQIPDGTSNTVLVTEGAKAVPWTKPEDINVAPGQPVIVGGANPQSVLMLFGDAGVRRVPRTALTDQVLRLLADPADGTPINLP